MLYQAANQSHRLTDSSCPIQEYHSSPRYNLISYSDCICDAFSLGCTYEGGAYANARGGMCMVGGLSHQGATSQATERMANGKIMVMVYSGVYYKLVI